MKLHHQVVIIGGGTAGIMTAAQLLNKNSGLDIIIIDPADKHYYQPAFTLVGGGAYDFKKTFKPMKALIPKGVKWLQDAVVNLLPEQNTIETKGKQTISYDYLIVAPGLVYDLTMIEGLEDAIKKGVACSTYLDPQYTWECIQKFKGGNAVFTQPTTPIKCGGAPQKIMYLAADHFRKTGVAEKADVIFATPGSVIFGVKVIAQTLMKVISRYGIHFRPLYAPVKIDADKKIIYFKGSLVGENKCVVNEGKENCVVGEVQADDSLVEIPFDLLHLAPPQRAPDFIVKSSLVNDAGWVDVDINSMQHKKYANVFSLGDVAALPTAKTGAAIRKQAPIVADNIFKLMEGKIANNKSYDGYSSCPLVTGYGKMALAEFNYKNEFTPDPKLKLMLVFTSYKEHWRLWIFKKYILPYLYWNKMMKGKNV